MCPRGVTELIDDHGNPLCQVSSNRTRCDKMGRRKKHSAGAGVKGAAPPCGKNLNLKCKKKMKR